ncbi:MAG: caspase family protein [Saprospiraceae bacterium]
MKRLKFYNVLVSLLLCTLTLAHAQQTKGVSPSETNTTPVSLSKTWAVIIGISDYQNNDVPDLSYANRDATAFADFLKSPGGGALDEFHIRLLINEQATMAQFAAAMDWLLDKVKEGDKAIIYFSGHGDVERKTITQPGFLLCWDAPSRVYMGGGAFGLAYLQEIVTTLSSDRKTKVILITDACHSGRLAGSEIGGMQATAANLSKQFANEVKLMSCQANELSLEGPQWGGGRGVFSYYLIKGLIGLADQNKDGLITLYEIEKYLSDKVPQSTAPKSQIPVAFGSKNSVIFKVDPASLKSLLNEEGEIVSNKETLTSRDSRSISSSIGSVFEKYAAFKAAIAKKNLLVPEEGSAYQYYLQLKDEPAVAAEINSLKSELAAALQDEAQQAINKYLESDYNEISSRWKFDSKYDKFVKYLNKAASLLGTSHYLYNSIKAHEYYYEGLNLRLKGKQEKNKEFVRNGIEKERMAVFFDPNASYAFNEMGMSFKQLMIYDSALIHFKKASSLSPAWILPRVNEMNTLREQKQFDLANIRASQIVMLDSSSYLVNFNIGLLKSENKDWNAASNFYLRALKAVSDDHDALYNLSYVYFKSNDYTRAENVVNKLFQINPDDLDLYIAMTCIKYQQGQKDEALKVLEEGFKKGFKNIVGLEAESVLADFIQGKDYLDLKKRYAK